MTDMCIANQDFILRKIFSAKEEVIIYKADGAEIELSADGVEFSSSKRDMAYPETEYNNYYAHVNELGYITVDGMRIKLGEIGEHVIDAVQFGL